MCFFFLLFHFFPLQVPIRITSRQQAVMLQDEAAQLCSQPYRAPELFDVGSDMEINEKLDVWSLGCVLFAITYGLGFSPYEMNWNNNEPVPCQVSMSAVINAVRIPTVVEQMYSKELKHVIEWMLTVDLKHRPKLPAVIDALDEKWPDLLYSADVFDKYIGGNNGNRRSGGRRSTGSGTGSGRSNGSGRSLHIGPSNV